MHKIKRLENIKVKINIPADKSISHRAIMLASLVSGRTRISPLLLSEDTKATLECIRRCGIKATLKNKKELLIEGEGLYYPKTKKVILNASESGTTFRIFSGILAAQKFPSCFCTSPSLGRRPMARVTRPLLAMGADIKAKTKRNEKYPPFCISPANKLCGIRYKLPVASAQVKSAILLASLYTGQKTQVIEPFPCRDHTERMLSVFGVKIKKKGKTITLDPVKKLKNPGKIFIPSDFSSASFFIVLGCILKNSEILIKDVNLNPTRSGLLKVLKRMGANIKVLNKKNYFEPYGDILVKSSKLHGTIVAKKEVPLMVDEIPILSVAASFAKGKTKILGAKELIVKETDRIKSILYNLKKAKVDVSARTYKDKGKTDWLIEVKAKADQRRQNLGAFLTIELQ